ncbi:MAG: adenylate cyclase [Sneathiella sp.]|uniref:adenylate/guanylate cyclase domain-containing protein n=1 Tax=Sneathiella sp. TaxID=1964365 RepID=UPI000C5CEA5D|nr:tetratricopeptide repeat protein [Sneathiella sp.]MAZ03021.1 adenylate cyclase [Sneathiella sp.]
MNQQRRLVTIMVADIVGYSRMMEQAEETAALHLDICQNLITKTVAEYDGRIFNRAGDAALAEFASPINAVKAAVGIREGLAAQDTDIADNIKMRFGLHLADVIVSGEDLIGDGVNLAARIQQQAEPDSIHLSKILFEQIKRNSPYSFDDLGEQRFKNISEPIQVYRLKGHLGSHVFLTAPSQRATAKKAILQNSLAVLPFSSIGGDDDQRYLAEGLTEEIILELARFRKLHVASRSASFAFLGQNTNPVDVARDLGVTYVLEGQVRRLGDKVRLSLELTNGQTGIAVWADRMARKFEDLFDLLDSMTTQVAATLLGRLEADAIEVARRKPPENMTSYDFMLRGLDLHRAGGITYDNSREAVSWFDKAINEDPSYGPAYAWRICAASWLPEFDINDEKRYIDKALELDANNAEAQRIMGVIAMLEGNYEAAEYHHKRAMALSPSDAYIIARCAAFYSFNGEPDKALELLEKAEELDGLLPVWCIEERGIAFFSAERYDLAVQAFNALPAQTSRSRLYLCCALVALGRQAEAEVVMHKALAVNKELTATKFIGKETWRDKAVRHQLRRNLIDAGLPK